MIPFALRKVVSHSFDEVLAHLPEAMKTEGFGVLTEVDVRETLKKKLGVDFRRYKILGACNPSFAHQALEAELEVGLAMPCNFVVYEADDGKTAIAAIDPSKTMAAMGSEKLAALANEVTQKLQRVLDRL
ncbi:MAG TPA: ABC transporter ATP-binding protein [Myxococcales bacterium]|jgi:uncharacterized protein (DUF302 family)|nr:ABC transporter ATP-binding protein [Myxococcales bacterium]